MLAKHMNRCTSAVLHFIMQYVKQKLGKFILRRQQLHEILKNAMIHTCTHTHKHFVSFQNTKVVDNITKSIFASSFFSFSFFTCVIQYTKPKAFILNLIYNSVFIFNTGAYYVVQVGLELVIALCYSSSILGL